MHIYSVNRLETPIYPYGCLQPVDTLYGCLLYIDRWNKTVLYDQKDHANTRLPQVCPNRTFGFHFHYYR